MRRNLAFAAAIGGLLLAPAAHGESRLESAVLAQLNFARTHPGAYGRDLRRRAEAGDFEGGSEIGDEDPDAVAEALDFLSRQRPLPPLKANASLAAAAAAHAGAQGRTLEVGHVSPDGATLPERLHAHGIWAGLSAEDISYGYGDAGDVVRQLIIDSGVPDRGHRAIIFDGALSAAGVSCGRHLGYGAMCVIDFAGAMVKREGVAVNGGELIRGLGPAVRARGRAAP